MYEFQIKELLKIVVVKYFENDKPPKSYIHFIKISDSLGIVVKLDVETPSWKINLIKPPFEWPYNNIVKEFDESDNILIQLQQYILEHV